MAFSDTLTHMLPAVGMLAYGPAGAGVGTILAGAAGRAQANKLENAAAAAEKAIPMYDPHQLSLINEVDRTRRAFQAGTDPHTSSATRSLLQTGSTVGGNVLRAGGPDVIQNLLRSQSATQQAIGKVAAGTAGAANDLLSLKGRLVDNAAERVYGQQRRRADDLLARAARSRQDANNNMLAGVPFLPQIGVSRSAPTSPFSELFGDILSGGSSRSTVEMPSGQPGSMLPSSYKLGDLTMGPPPVNFGFGY